MNDYVIMTDSSCDLPADFADELGIVTVPLTVTIGENEYSNYLDYREISGGEFYAQLRAGAPAKTSAANIERFESEMEQILLAGKDILYMGFSSALSGTYNSGTAAASILSERYPERKILTMDTLCASLGQGMLVYYTALEKSNGKSIEEAFAFAQNSKLKLCHWFTVSDLNFLRRGGRLSSAAALVGTVLNVKPILHVDNAGRLISVSKVRGRRASMRALVAKMKETAIDPDKQHIFISHGDCLDDAEYLAGLIHNEVGVKNITLNLVGPVIGAHSGPDTLALFFFGTQR